ncbi:unnamed protein product [Brugia pahangi]|uniref:Zonadhesin n=1 Tax=Brugia pahangi TaxID=6280 RepID=A0A0N4TTS5_BRUPA|nr:unnamed protein product [Brugia pahangi]
MTRKRRIVVSDDQTMLPKSDNMIVKSVDHMILKEGNDVIKDKDEEMEQMDEAMIVADNELASINDAKKPIEEIVALSNCEMEKNNEPTIILSKNSGDMIPMDIAILSVDEDGISVNEIVGLLEGNDKQNKCPSKDGLNECPSKDGLMIVMNSDKVGMDEVVSIDETMLVDGPLQSMDKIMISESTIMELDDQIVISKGDNALMEMDKIISSNEKVIKVENQIIISSDDVMEVKIDSIGSISAKLSAIDESMMSVDKNEQNVCSISIKQ